MIFVGYEPGSAAYRVYDPATRSADVIFDKQAKWERHGEQQEPVDSEFAVEYLQAAASSTPSASGAAPAWTTSSTPSSRSEAASAVAPMDDDDSKGHTINKDLRLMGVLGDNEEDLGEERDALRGLGSQGDTIDLAARAGDGDGEGRGDGTGTDSNTGGTGSSCLGHCGTRKRASTSEVWNDFDKIYKMINGVNVRWKARCHHCKGLLSAHSSSGTSHFSRHRDGCLKKLGKAAMTQSHISFNPDGTPRFWEYKPDRIALYKTFCTAMGVRPRKFGLNMDVRWNSTYLMLKHLIPYRSTFDTHYPKGDGNTPLLTDQHWYIAEKRAPQPSRAGKKRTN
ncbi:hypothetical protein U9M48_042029 [Paspalum notatum var. saurae]|uniref:Retroviral polymerase SH3-like domain-containing protein n=1 Tax=Paspalum notatum var. saurae TaxID=547442 RepID=A0AAQ3UW20_PASNO